MLGYPLLKTIKIHTFLNNRYAPLCPKFTCKNPMHKNLMIFNGSYPNIDVNCFFKYNGRSLWSIGRSMNHLMNIKYIIVTECTRATVSRSDP